MLTSAICIAFITIFWIPPMMWQLPSSCPAPSSNASGNTSISIFERIMEQGMRDIEGMVRLVTTSSTILSSTMFSGSAVQDLYSRFQDASQALSGFEMASWIKDYMGRNVA